jgi:hypothetical protein
MRRRLEIPRHMGLVVEVRHLAQRGNLDPVGLRLRFERDDAQLIPPRSLQRSEHKPRDLDGAARTSARRDHLDRERDAPAAARQREIRPRQADRLNRGAIQQNAKVQRKTNRDRSQRVVQRRLFGVRFVVVRRVVGVHGNDDLVGELLCGPCQAGKSGSASRTWALPSSQHFLMTVTAPRALGHGDRR